MGWPEDIKAQIFGHGSQLHPELPPIYLEGAWPSHFPSLSLTLNISQVTVIKKPVSLEDRPQSLIHCKLLGPWEQSLLFYLLFPPIVLLMGELLKELSFSLLNAVTSQLSTTVFGLG